MRINVANLISITRAVLAFVAAGLLLYGEGKSFALAAASVILIAVLLDALDGRIARRFGYQSKIGELSDLYTDHILANTVWVALSYLGFVSVWVPLITTTRDLIVDWFRQAGLVATGLNGFEQAFESRFKWVVSSREMRALYGVLKVFSWIGVSLASFLPIENQMQAIVWTTVAVCILRALPSISVNWKHIVFVR